MTDRKHPAGRLVLFACLFALVAGGCRTYGGHGSEEATYQEIRRANVLFAEALEEARRRGAFFETAAAGHAGVELLAEQWQGLVRAHEIVLAEHRLLEQELEGNRDHRALKRAFGTIVITQKSVMRHYDQFLDAAMTTADREFLDRRRYADESTYTLAPPYYARVRSAEAKPSLEEVLPRLLALPQDSLRQRAEAMMAPPEPSEVDHPGGRPGGGRTPEDEHEESAH